MTRKLRSITNKLSAAILLCLLLILWQAVSDLGLVQKFMFPSPVDVGAAFVEDFPILMANSGTTLSEGFLGLGLGIALAFVTAVLMDRYRFLYKSLYPILVITQTIPTVAIAPLLVLWMGWAPKIAASCFPHGGRPARRIPVRGSGHCQSAQVYGRFKGTDLPYGKASLIPGTVLFQPPGLCVLLYCRRGDRRMAGRKQRSGRLHDAGAEVLRL